ncbi:hypothetical protein M0208_06455 [Sphingomonas sp. SUN019]|uniref:hypothetical protein n=1 Tax=Sphingomonas sp. SUN019 TaxID=2937788 RepID=UPI002164C286|nr:hypothetical protein [Sphingomonas sp. SUN019]UVO50178.1 hypothetical protein M0208_06455 [Sphingomonas sp. SUN019]
MDHAHETIDRLCTLAGMIMEDTIETALVRDLVQTHERITQLAIAGGDIVRLAEAAAVVLRRWDH